MPARRHGLYKSPDYVRWTNMIQRCKRKNHPSYHRYGGRGITVCDRWLLFENFLTDMGACPSGLSLDRINNDGPYSKENCRYVDRKTQAWNKRATIWTCGLPRQEFCKVNKIGRDTFKNRLAKGMSIAQALSAPSKSFKLVNEQVCEIQRLYALGSYRLADLATQFGVGKMTIQRVVKNKYWGKND